MFRVCLLLLAAAQLCCGRDVYHRFFRGESPTNVNEAELEPEYWYNEASEGIRRRLRHHSDRRVAKNVVMFLGDGMSVPTLAAARALLGQREGRSGEEAELFFEAFPTVGLAKTYCVDAQVPDSACTATAYLCGAKTNAGTLGVRPLARGDCRAASAERAHVSSIAAWALEAGKDAGIVTTTRVTHASPAGAFAHSAERDWESDADVAAQCPSARAQPDIALQLVHSYPGNRFKVILGGGRREFLPNTTVDEENTPGKRLDGRNLIEEWKADKILRNVSHEYVWNRDQLMDLSAEPPEYLLGLFEGSHMHYHAQADAAAEPTLADLTEVAIRALGRNRNGFFLFVEGGRIDHAHHENYARLALDETVQLAEAVRRAARLLPEREALLVVTADHAHVMAYNGYSRRGAPVLGLAEQRGADGLAYTTLSYTNGPGHRAHVGGARPDLTHYDYEDAEFRFPAEVPLASETHGGDDVAVFARGPHHALFSGLYEQSQIPHLMAYAGCFGANVDLQLHCSTPDNSDA